jgi:hypothetical protein
MNLVEFFAQPGAPSLPKFAATIGMASEVPVRAWSKDPTKRPSPEYAPAVEAATDFKVRRWTMYPTNWWRIWPELVNDPAAPALPEGAEPIPPLTHAA